MPDVLWIMILSLSIGCSSSAPGADAGLTAEQACAAVSAARCTKLMSCSAADLMVRWGDLAVCETREALACEAGLAAPATAATPLTAIGCADAITAQACGDFLGKDPPAACLPVAGPAPVGAGCSFASQCASQFCAISATALCGSCQLPPQVGTSCASSGCGPTLTCVPATMTCQRPVAAAGACSRSLPCGAGLQCVGATMSAMGVCQASVTTSGAACDPQRKTGPDCSGPAGLTCDRMTKQCVVQPIVASGTCGLVNNIEVRCAGGATCSIAALATTGTCVAPAADGTACDAAIGPTCLAPARCVPAGSGTAGTCTLAGSATCP